MHETSDLNVLVVDSDKESKKEMCDALVELGLENLICANDGIEALGHIIDARDKEKMFNFIFCNWTLANGISGPQLVNTLNTKYPEITSIMYSSCDRPEIHIKSLIIGSMEFIEKGPSFKKELFEKVGKWIELEKLKIDYRENFNGQPA